MHIIPFQVIKGFICLRAMYRGFSDWLYGDNIITLFLSVYNPVNVKSLNSISVLILPSFPKTCILTGIAVSFLIQSFIAEIYSVGLTAEHSSSTKSDFSGEFTVRRYNIHVFAGQLQFHNTSWLWFCPCGVYGDAPAVIY